MRMNRFLLVAGAAASLSLTGCGLFGGSSEQNLSSAEEPVAAAGEQSGGNESQVASNTQSEPAPYVASYGLRRKFTYQYHPELEIYYSPESGDYFWHDGQKWVCSQDLPAMHDDFTFVDTVRITLNTDQPFTRHEHVLRAYPGYARTDTPMQPAFTGVETDR